MASTVVVGGGVAGLLAAGLLAEAGQGPVILLERAPTWGGLLASSHHGAAGRFDRGTHTLAQSGVVGLDEWLLSAEPEGGWRELAGAQRDVAGAYLWGRLQQGSPYPDLRDRPGLDAGLGAMMALLADAPPPDGEGAMAWLRARFGAPIAEAWLAPLLSHAFLSPAEELVRPLATALVPTERVVALDFEPWAQAIEAPALRARLACPDQARLPAHLASGRVSHYPRKGGMGAWVEALLRKLEGLGVQLWAQSEVQSLGLAGGRLGPLRGLRAGQAFELPAPDRLVWTSGHFALAPLLGIDPMAMGGEAPLRTALVHWRLDGPTGLGDLYYAFVLGGPGRGYRFTNYAAYAEDACEGDGWPLTLELLLPPGPPPGPELLAEAEADARRLGAIPAGVAVRHAVLEALPGGFPRPTKKHAAASERLRAAVAAAAPPELSCVGLGTEPGLFFQGDVLKQVWRRFGPAAQGA